MRPYDNEAIFRNKSEGLNPMKFLLSAPEEEDLDVFPSLDLTSKMLPVAGLYFASNGLDGKKKEKDPTAKVRKNKRENVDFMKIIWL